MTKTKSVKNVDDVVSRRASVSFEDFAKAYIAGAKSEKTPVEVASNLGMAQETFNQRAVAFRKFCRENGKQVLFLKTSRGRKSDVAKQVSIIDQLLSE